MTLVDRNGNKVVKSERMLKRKTRSALLAEGFRLSGDDYGRIMITFPDGKYIVFFRRDEPAFVKWLTDMMLQGKIDQKGRAGMQKTDLTN